MLDLEKFARPFQAIVPISTGSFCYRKKNYLTAHRSDSDNGWYKVEILGNKATILEPATIQDRLEIHQEMDLVFGYTHHNNIIFQNFDVAKKKFRLQIQTQLYFNQSQTFEAIRAVVWEDGLVYWAEPNYSDAKIFEIKDLYEQEKPITDQKGITPELRTTYLFHALERDQMRLMLEESKRAADHERMMKDIPYRLNITLKRIDADLIDYSISGERLIINWKLKSGNHRYNTVLDSKKFTILEAGFCLSGHDREHNLTSIVKLAESYEEEGLIHITRRTN